MRMKNFLGLFVVSAFTAKGIYELYKYYNHRNNPNQYLANITKNAIDGVNDLTKIFSNNKHEVEMCDNLTKISKHGIDYITEAERRY